MEPVGSRTGTKLLSLQQTENQGPRRPGKARSVKAGGSSHKTIRIKALVAGRRQAPSRTALCSTQEVLSHFCQ
jgi:hypothetical protein